MLVCATILSYLALIQPWSLRQTSLPLAVGDVASQDLRAPHEIQYVSKVLTDAARDEAERAVAPVYVPPDPAIARTQATNLTSILQSISLIRSDTNSSLEEKKNALIAIQGFTLQPDLIDFLLGLTDTRWTLVRSEAFNVLVETMRNPVRTENLDTIRQSLAALVSFSLTEREAALVVGLVSPLVVANSFYSPELTDAARQAARDAVQPVTRFFVAGQTVVTRGQVITPADLEALTALGLVQPKDPLYSLLGAAALVGLLAVFTALYFSRRQPVALSDLRSLLLLGLLFVILPGGCPYLHSKPDDHTVPFPCPGFCPAGFSSFWHGTRHGFWSADEHPVCLWDAGCTWLDVILYLEQPVRCTGNGTGRRVAQFLYAAVGDCRGRCGHDSRLPPAFHRDGLDRRGDFDGSGSFHGNGFDRSGAAAAISAGAVHWPDNCPAIA